MSMIKEKNIVTPITKVDANYIKEQNFNFTENERPTKYLFKEVPDIAGEGFFVPEPDLPKSLDLDKNPNLTPPKSLTKSGQVWRYRKHIMDGQLGLMCVLIKSSQQEVL